MPKGKAKPLPSFVPTGGKVIPKTGDYFLSGDGLQLAKQDHATFLPQLGLAPKRYAIYKKVEPAGQPIGADS